MLHNEYDTLTNKVKEYKELTTMIDELKQEADSIADKIKTEVISRDTDEIRADIYKVPYKEVTSSRFDTKGFKAKYAERYNRFVKQSTSHRFSIA